MHFGDPITQRVGDELKRVGRAHEQRVAGAGGVEVMPRIAIYQTIVRLVVDAPEAQGRAHVVAFGGVVVNHVEDDLDASAVVCLDHRLELVDLLAALA